MHIDVDGLLRRPTTSTLSDEKPAAVPALVERWVDHEASEGPTPGF